ncbi:hypothetical protein P170DRAFT_509755 [Aspergillus steynii IBT 23096]|uniref:Uncharacterized protein n=1 Tax=Aspergillus steynii IBT 23096 TaxID=1392250 RepID=A0A2I2G8H2_9EURO|nr:uncharacterized protein P170DRAFT_509755 [Aspergillus steynii IBT 23096]PLB49143.1 hypothetical protein P170DRAFT_509755 [Aspergillus steynii IBT 23096]
MHARSPSPSSTDPRKRTKQTHPTPNICHDWMVVSGNCHYARDLAHFTSYRPVSAVLKNNLFNAHDELRVAGVGSVLLTTCRSATDPSPRTIRLDDVLHIPDALCNGFNPLLVGSSMSCHATHWEGADREGEPLWWGRKAAGGTKVVLVGEPESVSELIGGREYTLSLYVSGEEKGAMGLGC